MASIDDNRTKICGMGGDDEPLYGKTYLPRKFKIAIAIPPQNDVDILLIVWASLLLLKTAS